MGNSSVYENGMTLHHVYGFPYFPGSGVKGMVRTWVVNECFGHEKDSEEKALQNPLFKAMFGHGKLGDLEGQQGSRYCFDALPLEAPDVAPDVTNNHYQEYYEGKGAPGDWIAPNPIFFLSVKGGHYRFQLGFKPLVGSPQKIGGYNDYGKVSPKRFGKFINADSSVLDLAVAWLKNALKYHGVGAKTAVGYGSFQTTKI